MQIDFVHDRNPPGRWRGCCLSFGNFDGVHRGHRRIVATARALGDAEGLCVVALTFEPPPDRVLRPDDVPQRISPPDEKARLLLAAGCDRVVVVRPGPELLEMPPQAFVDEVVVPRLAPRHVVEGRNFFFGRDRAGNVDTLRAAGQAAGFVVHVVDPVLAELPEGPRHVSSTLIRRLVAEGRIEDANRCLAKAFALYGTVIAGQGRGREMVLPTSNISAGEQVCPPDGVYAGSGEVGGRAFPAAISIGEKPTFAPADRAVEAHLVGAGGDFYGRRLTLRFIRRLRDQVRFDGPEQLRQQIEKDIESVRKIHEHPGAGA